MRRLKMLDLELKEDRIFYELIKDLKEADREIQILANPQSPYYQRAFKVYKQVAELYYLDNQIENLEKEAKKIKDITNLTKQEEEVINNLSNLYKQKESQQKGELSIFLNNFFYNTQLQRYTYDIILKSN